MYVSGPATFGLNVAPAVFAYDLKSKALVAQYPVTISNGMAGMRALSCIAFGPDGKLYAIEPFVGVVRMDLDDANTQSVYSAFPPAPGPSLPNDLAFDDAGNLFVTDSFQGLIYRIPAGGGAPLVWFQDPRLLGHPDLPFGVNGIRIDRNNKRMYVSVTVDAQVNGVIYRLPMVGNPAASDVEVFHTYAPGEMGPMGPDGFAFGKSGLLYVALAASSQISVLRPDGTEAMRISGPAGDTPWANPANIAFDDQAGTLLVTNHASLVPYDPTLFVLFDVVVNDKAAPLL